MEDNNVWWLLNKRLLAVLFPHLQILTLMEIHCLMLLKEY